MRRLGFIHDMLDVKVLILFVMARVSYPVNMQEIYELCYQDECLSRYYHTNHIVLNAKIWN